MRPELYQIADFDQRHRCLVSSFRFRVSSSDRTGVLHRLSGHDVGMFLILIPSPVATHTETNVTRVGLLASRSRSIPWGWQVDSAKPNSILDGEPPAMGGHSVRRSRRVCCDGGDRPRSPARQRRLPERHALSYLRRGACADRADCSGGAASGHCPSSRYGQRSAKRPS